MREQEASKLDSPVESGIFEAQLPVKTAKSDSWLHFFAVASVGNAVA
jgi:hypothetical protein